MIHLTPNGIYADSKEEIVAFYDRLHAGDPVELGHLMLYEMKEALLNPIPGKPWNTDLLGGRLGANETDTFIFDGEIL